MNANAPCSARPPDTGHYELRFESLYSLGRGLAVPCDAGGHVDLNALSERMRVSYLGARALIGWEYAYPTVRLLQ